MNNSRTTLMSRSIKHNILFFLEKASDNEIEPRASFLFINHFIYGGGVTVISFPDNNCFGEGVRTHYNLNSGKHYLDSVSQED